MKPTDLNELAQTAEALQQREYLEQAEITRLADTWRERLSLQATEEERFDVCDASGELSGVTAPRWLCHLLGLRHRVTHIILRSPQDLLVLQVRSPNKADWPNHIDTSVGGHVRAGQNFYQAAVEEMEQELGLPSDDLASWLVGGRLEPVGEPYVRADYRTGTPPFRNSQVNQLYAGQLTPRGLPQIHFRDGEVSALYLCNPDEAQRLVTEGERAAPGLTNALPRYLNTSWSLNTS
ncbi:MAG: Nudix hydrolase [Anaerolineales bacterium]|nr:Nudix hydrolase [Anaerolineales bacterium]